MSNRVAMLPYGMKPGPSLARLPLDRLVWPLGTPAGLGGQVGDLGPDDHLFFVPGTSALIGLRPRLRCKVSLVLAEPRAYHGRYYRLARLLHRRFHRVVTYDESLLQTLPNALRVYFGTTWVPDWAELDLTKDEDVSLIASSKRKMEGHKLRHAVARACAASEPDVAVMGRGYRAFERKSDGLARFRFSVVIENCRQRNYFTEKLIDAIVCDTIPIYWGCPNIGDFFDTRGIVVCESEAEILAAIRAAGAERHQAMLPWCRENRIVASRFFDYERRIAERLLADDHEPT